MSEYDFRLKEEGMTLNKNHSTELFYIEEKKFPFALGFYERSGCSMHWHHSWEVLCQLEGETKVSFADGTFVAVPGDITVITGEEPHATERISNEHSILLLQFQLESILPYFAVSDEYQYIYGTLLRPFNKVPHFTFRSKEIEELLKKTAIEYENRNPGYDIMIPAYIMELFVYFQRNGFIAANSSDVEVIQSIKKVKQAILYIEENYSQYISLHKVAELANLSEYAFCRIFKKATTYTFVEYLNHTRLKHSEKMLLSTKMPISDVAFENGFSSLSYFNRKFKERYSMSPSKYRKMSGLNE